MIDDGRTILDHRHRPPNQGNIKALPNIGPARLLRMLSKEAIDPSGTLTGRLVCRVCFNLHLITASQIHPAVSFKLALKIEVQLEIFELTCRYDFGAISVFD